MQWIEEDRPHHHSIATEFWLEFCASKPNFSVTAQPPNVVLYKGWGCRSTPTWPTSMSNIYKVIDVFHMQSIEKDRPHHHSIATEFWLEFCKPNFSVTALSPNVVLYKGWGFRSTQTWSHINVKHIQGDWRVSYAMDRGRQTPSPLHCHRVLAGILQVSPTSWLLP